MKPFPIDPEAERELLAILDAPTEYQPTDAELEEARIDPEEYRKRNSRRP